MTKNIVRKIFNEAFSAIENPAAAPTISRLMEPAQPILSRARETGAQYCPLCRKVVEPYTVNDVLFCPECGAGTHPDFTDDAAQADDPEIELSELRAERDQLRARVTKLKSALQAIAKNGLSENKADEDSGDDWWDGYVCSMHASGALAADHE